MKSSIDSPILNHYLESVLPHPNNPSPKQFIKNREFYKPQAFIWNNPHRASQQMYKFYHSYNDQYCKNKEPLIRKQEEQDRQDADKLRIHRLIAFRNKAREEFLQKQKNREVLEEKARKGNHTATRSIRTEAGIPLQSQYKSQTAINNDKMQTGTLKHVQHSQRAIRIEGAYRTSLAKHDAKTQQINKLIEQQNEDFQKQIRSEFAARRQSNGSINIKLRSLKKKLPDGKFQ